MKKTVVLFVMLLIGTALAGITVSADDILEEQKKHVTPEQWVEIEKLLDENQKTGALPDLEITAFWKSGNRLYATVHNRGDGYAHAFSVDFHVWKDGKWNNVGRDWVWLGLRAGYSTQVHSSTVPYHGRYYCRVYADYIEKLPESNEYNNDDYAWFTFS